MRLSTHTIALAALVCACSRQAPAVVSEGAQPAAEPIESAAEPAPSPSASDEPLTSPRERAASDDSGQAASDDRPLLTSVRSKTWIWKRPSKAHDYIGMMRVGQRVALAAEETVPGEGCPQGFYPVEPRGYVCNDATVTRAGTTPFLVANAHTLPSDGPYPYRYALSDGAPMYARLPTEEEQRRHEVKYGPAGRFEPLKYQRGHEHLAVKDPIEPTSEIPPFLAAGRGARGPVLSVFRRTLPRGAMVAFTEAFEHEGRTFLLSADLTVIPADRMRRFRRSQFRGVKLREAGVNLPLAWFRERARARYRFVDGAPVEQPEPFALRTWIALAGEEREHAGRSYLRVAGGDWVAAEDATVVEHYGKRPFGVGQGDRWILVSIIQGTLVAYEGLTPVFSTLISPGRGGVPRKGGDPVEDSTTPLGSFKVTYKDRATTMAPEFGENRKFWIADVPHTQYFNPPFALHGAYWHEKFGEPMSAGCVNLSPIDAEHLFGWTEPQVPPGWQGITGHGAKDEGVEATWIVIKR